MLQHMIGTVCLNLSTMIYLIWFIPQILLTRRRASVTGLSLWMVSILTIGYICDLIYALGRHMPGQYCLVSIVGLVFLGIQHQQFKVFMTHKKKMLLNLHVFFILLLVTGLYFVWITPLNKQGYDTIGFVSTACWFSYLFPQIIKNYQRKSTTGFSLGIIVLSLFSSICDMVAAYALGWDMPSLLSSPLGFIKKATLLLQYYYYNRKTNIPTFAH